MIHSNSQGLPSNEHCFEKFRLPSCSAVAHVHLRSKSANTTDNILSVLHRGMLFSEQITVSSPKTVSNERNLVSSEQNSTSTE